jgi:uncharacterized protein
LSTYFVDTSAIAKRYVVENGTGWVRGLIQPAAGNVTTISELTTVELFSLLARKRREGVLSAVQIGQVQQTFLSHVRGEYLVVLLDSAIVAHARDLVNKYPLRSLDAIQLASAMHVQHLLGEPLTFISADRNLLSASAAEGFSTDDPNAHP